MKKAALDLSWEEVGILAEGLSFSNRPLKSVTKGITAEYRLGPRGAWILLLVDNGLVVYPLDVTNYFYIARSVITEELARLTEARLINYRKSTEDRRRVKLELTPLGKKTTVRIREELRKLINERFAAHPREKVLEFSNMLQDFLRWKPATPELQSDEGDGAAVRRASKRAKR